MSSKQKWAIGTTVEAKAKGWTQMYKGKVSAYDESTNSYQVTFDDGDVQTGIKSFNIRGISNETFTAPDGKVFNSKSEYRKYMSEVYYSVRNVKGEQRIKREGDVGGQAFSIADLESSEVFLLDVAEQVLIDNLENSKLVIGPSSGSVFLRKAKNCTLYIACKQFRCRDCENCVISLYSKTEPVIETSTKMRFYPYNAWYPKQTSHFTQAKLEPTHNHWCNIFDFNAGDSSIPEPHYELIPKSEGWPKWELQGEANCENPVPEDARAEVAPKEGSFGIEALRLQPPVATASATAQVSTATPSITESAAPVPPPSQSNVVAESTPPPPPSAEPALLPGVPAESVILVIPELTDSSASIDQQRNDAKKVVDILLRDKMKVCTTIDVESPNALHFQLGEDWSSKVSGQFGKPIHALVLLSLGNQTATPMETAALHMLLACIREICTHFQTSIAYVPKSSVSAQMIEALKAEPQSGFALESFTLL